MKLFNYFLAVGTAIFFTVSTLSGRGIFPSLVVLKPRYPNSFPAKKNFSFLTLNLADYDVLRNLSSFLI